MVVVDGWTQHPNHRFQPAAERMAGRDAFDLSEPVGDAFLANNAKSVFKPG